jgi:hypothetical protein
MSGKSGQRSTFVRRNETKSHTPSGVDVLLSNNIEIPGVGSNLVKDAIWVVPLIEHGLDLILLSFEPEPNRAFIGLSARVTFHAQLHHFQSPRVR